MDFDFELPTEVRTAFMNINVGEWFVAPDETEGLFIRIEPRTMDRNCFCLNHGTGDDGFEKMKQNVSVLRVRPVGKLKLEYY